MEKEDIRICPYCQKKVKRLNMKFTKDCHGIIFQLVCIPCWNVAMKKGYDGVYYERSNEDLDVCSDLSTYGKEW